jgi:hypothetical protein
VVHRIWGAHGLQPHSIETFKLSRDPDFVAKLRDVVDVYLNPSANALVFCIDEKLVVAQSDRALVRRDHPQAHSPGHLPERARAHSRHRRLRHASQPPGDTFNLDGDGRDDSQQSAAL